VKPFSKIFTGNWMINFVAASGWLQLGLKDLGIHTGDPYTITDAWSGSFEGRIYLDPTKSEFK